LGVDPLYRPLVAPGQLLDLARPRVVAPLRETHGEDTVRVPREHDPHRVHAVDDFAVLDRAARIARGHAQLSSASARSMSPSIGFTAVTTTRRCAPVRSRRPVRWPRQAWPSSSMTYRSSRRLLMCRNPSTATSRLCTK